MTQLFSSDGKSVKLYSCAFAGEERVVCKYGGFGHLDGKIVGFSRMFVSIPTGEI